MSPHREWLNEKELEGWLAPKLDQLSERRREDHTAFRDEVRGDLAEHKVLLDKIADGAQASLYSATLLHGNPSIGLKGFIPEVQERLKALEDGAQADRETNKGRHDENCGRLEKLEAGQGRIRRAFAWCLRLAIGEVKKSSDPEKRARRNLKRQSGPSGLGWLLSVDGITYGWHSRKHG